MGKTLSPITRKRLDVQGWGDVPDATLAEVGSWLRMATGICASLVAVGTLMASPLILWTLVPLGVFGALFPIIRSI